MNHLSEKTDVKGREGERVERLPTWAKQENALERQNTRYEVFDLLDEFLHCQRPTYTGYWFCTARILDYICKIKLWERRYVIGEHLFFRASRCERREAYARGGGKGDETGPGAGTEILKRAVCGKRFDERFLADTVFSVVIRIWMDGYLSMAHPRRKRTHALQEGSEFIHHETLTPYRILYHYFRLPTTFT